MMTFRAAEWSGATTADRLAVWVKARRAYAEVHGGPGGPAEMILAEREARGLFVARPGMKPPGRR